jgi:hypothetical protein
MAISCPFGAFDAHGASRRSGAPSRPGEHLAIGDGGHTGHPASTVVPAATNLARPYDGRFSYQIWTSVLSRYTQRPQPLDALRRDHAVLECQEFY